MAVADTKIDLSSDAGVIQALSAFCTVHGISTNGILVITFHEGHTTNFSSLIADFERKELLPVFPVAPDASYKELELKLSGATLYVVFAENQERPPTAAADRDSSVPTVCNAPPFCCSDIRAYKPQKLHDSMERKFAALLKRRGHVPEAVFQVKRQINHHPKIVTQYFTLRHDTVKEFDAHGKYKHKLHAFKNFVCKTHDLFFGVDLYSNTPEYNYHHMRLNPFLAVNTDFLARVF